jgi:hypothetical protein
VDKPGHRGTKRDASENGRFFSFYLQKISRLKAIWKAIFQAGLTGRKQDFKTSGLQGFKKE